MLLLWHKLISSAFVTLIFCLMAPIGQAMDSEKINSHQFSEEQKNWWAVQPLRLGKVDGPGNPIDFFIKRKLKGENLTLANQAGPYEYIRRASYDLWGLPPKPKEVEAFVKSFEKDPLRAKVALVDRLLADRAYGKRWATHWLDVVRFADIVGA